MVTRDVRTFPDLPIAGMVGDKEAVYITLDYAFEDYTIHVEHVFAWRDRETGDEYIPGDLAIVVDEEVQHFAAPEQGLLLPRRNRGLVGRVPS